MGSERKHDPRRPTVECPHCHEPHEACITTAIDPRQKISIAAQFTGPFINAHTAGELLSSTAKLLEAVGDHVGAKTVVWLESIAVADGEFRADLVISSIEAADAIDETAPEPTP